ncbi:metal ABC transporter permease [Pseudooctadecabacter jejudonensis]|uniref:High-affinity zinc uptake system membrane protein ZnuB n=1 Tax=Pseudooctadecabacter jejudonensis TaxID=1391910 RepID=A0A1Y5RQN9_9RHOB|nr:metal ABC transporter permease [Pseudooctadecabacter jejudonensis]SLN23118.1 High-affinity zinc uptake system membrane protein ZnuB [Pseudooctadecabacter jejudonensis]
MVRALLAGVGTALACGALGCFIVWRRMAYFGDATAHAAILGVALALMFSISVPLGVLIVALAMGLLVGSLSGATITPDSLLGVLSHGALALGLVAVSLMPGTRIDLDAYLFGDILVVSRMDLIVIWGGAAVVLAVLAWRWQALLAEVLSNDLAHAAGLHPARDRLFLTLLVAMVVAVSIKVVGALLITAMLIIPAAAARMIARGPEAMAVWATCIGIVASAGGLYAARFVGTPAGPSIIVAAAALFCVTAAAGRLRG